MTAPYASGVCQAPGTKRTVGLDMLSKGRIDKLVGYSRFRSEGISCLALMSKDCVMWRVVEIWGKSGP